MKNGTSINMKNEIIGSILENNQTLIKKGTNNNKNAS